MAEINHKLMIVMTQVDLRSRTLTYYIYIVTKMAMAINNGNEDYIVRADVNDKKSKWLKLTLNG